MARGMNKRRKWELWLEWRHDRISGFHIVAAHIEHCAQRHLDRSGKLRHNKLFEL
jgi:hypothetical protein